MLLIYLLYQQIYRTFLLLKDIGYKFAILLLFQEILLFTFGHLLVVARQRIITGAFFAATIFIATTVLIQLELATTSAFNRIIEDLIQ